MTPQLYASLRTIILRDIAELKAGRRAAWLRDTAKEHRFAIRERQRALADLRVDRELERRCVNAISRIDAILAGNTGERT